MGLKYRSHYKRNIFYVLYKNMVSVAKPQKYYKTCGAPQARRDFFFSTGPYDE